MLQCTSPQCLISDTGSILIGDCLAGWQRESNGCQAWKSGTENSTIQEKNKDFLKMKPRNIVCFQSRAWGSSNRMTLATAGMDGWFDDNIYEPWKTSGLYEGGAPELNTHSSICQF